MFKFIKRKSDYWAAKKLLTEIGEKAGNDIPDGYYVLLNALHKNKYHITSNDTLELFNLPGLIRGHFGPGGFGSMVTYMYRSRLESLAPSINNKKHNRIILESSGNDRMYLIDMIENYPITYGLAPNELSRQINDMVERALRDTALAKISHKPIIKLDPSSKTTPRELARNIAQNTLACRAARSVDTASKFNTIFMKPKMFHFLNNYLSGNEKNAFLQTFDHVVVLNESTNDEKELNYQIYVTTGLNGSASPLQMSFNINNNDNNMNIFLYGSTVNNKQIFKMNFSKEYYDI